MNEAKLRRLIECGDSAALHSYIHQSSSPLSQPLGAQARFAYFQIQRGSSTTNAAPLSTTALSDSYLGPKTTVVHVMQSATRDQRASFNNYAVAECSRRLQSLEAEEKHARSRIESDLIALIDECHRWRRAHADRCARAWTDLFAAEHIARSAVAAAEIQCFRDILEAALDDIAGCRWDSVRMQWLRREMAGALAMHEWVLLHSMQPARRHTRSHSPALPLPSSSRCHQPAEDRFHHAQGEPPMQQSVPLDQREMVVTPSPKPRRWQQQCGHQSMCARPLRPRVTPPLASQECAMS